MRWALLIVVALMVSWGVTAVPSVDLGECYVGSYNTVYVAFDPGAEPENISGVLTVENTCEGSTELEFLAPVELTLGNVTEGEIVITSRSVAIDTVARPDLDVPARITFRDIGFAVEPEVLKDGEPCPGGECTNQVFNPQQQTFAMTVSGFSNYSLTGQQDFVVYSDPQPELRARVYQTIDLGDLYRADEFKCIVQVYGQNEAGQFVLVQTNPKRNPQGLIVSPDPNLPESLGYFKTEGGLANVYFDGKPLAGYQELEYVAQCASNSTKLVFEEAIATRYVPMGRGMVGRGVWLTSGDNMFYLIIGTVLVVIAGLVLWKAVRMVSRWR